MKRLKPLRASCAAGGGMIALGIVVVIALLFIFFIALRRRSPATLRRIPAFDRLNREIGLAVENGTRLHISLGRGWRSSAELPNEPQLATARQLSLRGMPPSRSSHRIRRNPGIARRERRNNSASPPDG